MCSEIVVQHIETNVFAYSLYHPFYYKRYVDDTFIIWTHGPEKLQNFLDNFNAQIDSIKFTVETETNKTINFLDLKISRGYRNHLWFDIHSKPSTIPAPILAHSAHPISTKLSFFRSYINRAFTHTTFAFSETRHLKNIVKLAVDAGYKPKILNNIINQKRNLVSNLTSSLIPHNYPPSNLPLKYLPSVPFSPEFIKIAKFLKKKCNLILPFSAPKTISKLVVTDRQTSSSGGGGVYSIPFTAPDGSRTYYIGQTFRSISTRIKEHESSNENIYCNTAVKTFLKNNPSAIAHWKEIKIIASPPTQAQLLCRESIAINMTDSVINAKDGKNLNRIWLPYLRGLNYNRTDITASSD